MLYDTKITHLWNPRPSIRSTIKLFTETRMSCS